MNNELLIKVTDKNRIVCRGIDNPNDIQKDIPPEHILLMGNIYDIDDVLWNKLFIPDWISQCKEGGQHRRFFYNRSGGMRPKVFNIHKDVKGSYGVPEINGGILRSRTHQKDEIVKYLKQYFVIIYKVPINESSNN